MKINSHLLGIGVGLACVLGWMWFTSKPVEVFMGFSIYKKGNRFVAELVAGDRDKNPDFATVEEVKAWIVSKTTPADAVSAVANAVNNMPWG